MSTKPRSRVCSMLPLKAFTPNEENGGQLRGLCGIAGIPFLRVRRIQMRLFKRHWAVPPANRKLAISLLLTAAAFGADYSTWKDYGGSADSMQYSSLRQINKNNVKSVELAWFAPAPGPNGRFAFSPLIVDNVMYVVGKDSAIIALDAATGKQVWSHPVEGKPTDRGFNYWQSKDGADRRLIFAANSYLQ